MNRIKDTQVALINHIDFVQQKMDEIEQQKELTIHEMADLERYANTMKCLAITFSLLKDD